MSGYVASRAKLILAALKEGQKHKRMLCTALNSDYQRIDPTMAELLRRREVIILGTAIEAGYKDIKAHAPVYGLPGMTLQPVVEEPKRPPAQDSTVYPDDIRIAQPRTIPQYHSNGWSRIL